MYSIFSLVDSVCVDCLKFGKCFSFYGLLALLLTICFDKKLLSATIGNYKVPADFPLSPSALIDAQTMICIMISLVLNPQVYISILKSIAKKIGTITKITTYTFPHNCWRMFLFYYIIVSAPAVAMVPTNFQHAKYNIESVIALLMMMLTNAVGDVISIKITLSNIAKVAKYHDICIAGRKDATFRESMKTEGLLYAYTFFDMTIALGVLVLVLVLTSVYFGVSIGEYHFEFSNAAFSGAWNRICTFWTTANEPYGFRKTLVASDWTGPMLLIYSVTSFIPTFLILLFALVWTAAMPLRIIVLSSFKKPLRLLISQSIIGVQCIIGSVLFKQVSYYFL